VKEFTSEDERRISVILDTTLYLDTKQSRETFERGVTLAASLVKHFIDERAEVRLIVGDEEGRFGSGLEHLYDCLRRLALAKSNSKDGDMLPLSALEEKRALSVTGDFGILVTAAAPGTIPPLVWRNSHVIYL
jgi:uncharacterized protein (DUF58 family)